MALVILVICLTCRWVDDDRFVPEDAEWNERYPESSGWKGMHGGRLSGYENIWFTMIILSTTIPAFLTVYSPYRNLTRAATFVMVAVCVLDRIAGAEEGPVSLALAAIALAIVNLCYRDESREFSARDAVLLIAALVFAVMARSEIHEYDANTVSVIEQKDAWVEREKRRQLMRDAVRAINALPDGPGAYVQTWHRSGDYAEAQIKIIRSGTYTIRFGHKKDGKWAKTWQGYKCYVDDTVQGDAGDIVNLRVTNGTWKTFVSGASLEIID